MILISKDSKGKIRVVDINYKFTSPVYIITRTTGVFNGKMIEQPDIIVEKGKAKRTLLQQTKLEFDSKVKTYLDKGYKQYDKLTKIPFDQISVTDIALLIANEKTDQDGIIKPMLAKDYNKCSINVLEQDWLSSPKLDGVRCLFSWNGKEIIASRRGGGNYNPATTHLRTDPRLIELFKDNPKIILDGELYIHGVPLQQISGLARLKENSPKTEALEFWIYDLVDLDNLLLPFIDRLDKLIDFRVEYLPISNFHKLREFRPEYVKDNNSNVNDKIKIINHKKVSGFAAVDLNHNRFVDQGYEGIIVRDPNKEYGIGKRDIRMLKYKNYVDEEFKITGFEEGLRDEDFVFVCVTEEGKQFKAKPIGTRELKDEYRNNLESIIGKMATVKFFCYSEDKIPLQPVLKSIRDYGE